MYQRPKLGESDEDLLKLQEEFLNNKSEKKFKPAATVVKDAKQDVSNVQEQPNATEDIQEHLDNTFEDIPKNIKIGGIVEKQPEVPRISKFKFSRSNGFPQAKRRDPTLAPGKGSLFSQQMKRQKTNDSETMEVDTTPINPMNLQIKQRLQEDSSIQSTSQGVSVTDNKPRNLPAESFIIQGEDKEEIHNQNVDIMSQMTEQEILEEREKLMSMMDPAIIAFLKSKRHHNKPIEETRQPSIAEQNKYEDVKLEDLDPAVEILSVPDSDKWLNFDVLETTKLAWMRDISVPKISKDKQYEARFDFAGWLLPFSQDDINEKNRVLYHHGDEPGRPGYTLQELFQLCRSSVIQQKIVALNTIANVLNLQSSGIYDGVIDIPIEQIFFVVRFCLDENTPATLTASIKCMRNLFYYPIDETCLDSLLGFGLGTVQPILAIDNTETEDDKTVNDQQLAETNLVKCLARTDILVRIRYIINVMKPSIETVVYCLEILIRLVRDSNFIMMQVYKSEDLLSSIIANFLPKIYKPCPLSSAYGLPLTHAIKFLRVLSARSKTIGKELVEKYKVLDSIATYLSNEFVSVNTNGLKLQIESMYLWSTFLHYGLGVDYFKVLQPVLIRLLEYHLANTDATALTSYAIQAHISSFMNMVSQVMKYDYNCTLIYIKMMIDTGIPKWCTNFNSVTSYSCGKLQIISSMLNLLHHLVKYQPLNVHLPLEKIYQIIETMIHSKGFQIVTQTLKNGSNILNNYETHKCSANFKYTEAAVWNASDHVIPIIQTTSCIPFLCSLSNFIESSNSTQLKLSFLVHSNIENYLRNLQSSNKFYLTSNWYTKFESTLIINILKISVAVQNNLDTGPFYDIAIKILCVFNAEQKTDVEYILRNIVFSPKFYPSEIFMKNLNLNDEDSILKVCLENINEIFEVYIKVLQLRTNIPYFTTNLSTDLNIGNIMPIDWIYSPIVVLYSNQQEKKSPLSEQEQVFIVLNCLRWIYIYEMYFPSLATLISPTDRFCRLACTFLGSDSLFLIPEIRNMLEKCLKSVIEKSEADIDFDKTIQGLSNFQDFYTQLLEQYQGVSYGDKLFGNFILIPLAQRHNIKLRKTLWSEYAGIVQIFNLTENEIFCPMELFLKPNEDDISLLRCYRRILVSGLVRNHSVLYQIAKHHVNAYCEKKRASTTNA